MNLFMKAIMMGFLVEQAKGGYFVWCRLPDNLGNGVGFSIQLYDSQKVGVVPCIHFSSKADKWIRINVARGKEELIEALHRIEKFMNQENAYMKS